MNEYYSKHLYTDIAIDFGILPRGERYTIHYTYMYLQ